MPPPVAAPAPTVAVPAVAPAPPLEPPPAEAAPRPHHARLLGGRKVVLEYDTHPSAPAPPPPPPAGVDESALNRARDTYQRGNSYLFAGRTADAIAAYREAIKLYPGYVAGYRGLGLAYAELGNAAEALTALRLYVATVPDARDVPMLKRRIQRLEKGR